MLCRKCKKVIPAFTNFNRSNEIKEILEKKN